MEKHPSFDTTVVSVVVGKTCTVSHTKALCDLGEENLLVLVGLSVVNGLEVVARNSMISTCFFNHNFLL